MGWTRGRAALFALGLGATLAFVPRASAVWPPDSSPRKSAIVEVRKFIAAARKSDYGAITADGDPTFAEVTRQQFEAFAAKFGCRLTACANISWLGELKRGGEQVALWRIAFNDGGDDLLMQLGMKDERVTSLEAD
jgi:hypothetical protein